MIQQAPYSLFQLKTLTKRMSSFGFPSDLYNRLAKIQKWLAYVREGRQIDEATHAEYLYDIFVDVLGYRSPFQPNTQGWELEFNPQPALGFFTSQASHPIAEIFVYEPARDLDQDLITEIDGRLESSHPTTEWLIVTNYQEIRLYHCAKPTLFFQRFLLTALFENLEYLKQFYFILCRRTLLTGAANSSETSRTSQLLEESQQLEVAIAKEFYSHYHKIRLQLVKDFRYRLFQLPNHGHSNQTENLDTDSSDSIVNQLSITQAQKLLNRILFIAYCEDYHIFPDGMLAAAYEFHNPYIKQPIWENYKAIFRWIYQGNSKHNPPIFSCKISLFEPDDVLDKQLFVGDELCRQIKELTRFDFKEEISGIVLTYILEESVRDTDLLIKKGLEDHFKRRKFRYPPKSLLSSKIFLGAVRAYLNQSYLQNSQRESEDFANHESGSATEYLQNQNLEQENNQQETNQENYQENQQNHKITNLKLQQQALLTLKVVDSKCQSGTALAIIFDFLLAQYEQINAEIIKLKNNDSNASEVFSDSALLNQQEMIKIILQHNLYGCHPSTESVEITKLCLWLRAIQLAQPLVPLKQNIQQGNLSTCNFGAEFDQAAKCGSLITI